MKILTDQDIIRIIEGASDAAILAAQAAIPRPGRDMEDDWLAYGVKEGFYQVAEIQVNGRPVATAFYSMDGRTLRINAYHAFDKSAHFDEVMEIAFARLAGDRNATRVQFETKRGGAIRKAIKHGYEICGVILRREISGVPTVAIHSQAEQQQQSGPSFSKSSPSETQTATNEQVGSTGEFAPAFGASSSGNTSVVNVTTSDVNALNESEDVSNAALASNTNVSTAALAANIAALQAANATAQMGLNVGGAAIASNTNIAGAAIASGNEETIAGLEAAQNLGGESIAAGVNLAGGVEATSLDDLEASLAGAATLTAGSQQTESNIVQSALAAVLAGQSNSNSLVQSVVNSNTAALENSDTLAYETAAGAQSQEGQIVGALAGAGALGTAQVSSFGASPLAGGSGNSELLLLGIAAVAVIGLVLAFK